MTVRTDPVTGHQVDDFEPTRPLPYASSLEVAQRQTTKAAARLRSGEVLDSETAMAEGRRRFLAAHGITEAG